MKEIRKKGKSDIVINGMKDLPNYDFSNYKQNFKNVFEEFSCEWVTKFNNIRTCFEYIKRRTVIENFKTKPIFTMENVVKLYEYLKQLKKKFKLTWFRFFTFMFNPYR